MTDRVQGIITADGQEEWIHIVSMESWEPAAVCIKVTDGVVSVEAIQDGVRVFADLLNLRKGKRSSVVRTT